MPSFISLGRAWELEHFITPSYVARVSEAYEKQVFYNNGWELEWIPHCLEVVPNLIFSTIKSLTWYIFKTHRNHTGKIQDSLENSESKKSFSQDTLRSILFDWDLILAPILLV